MKEKVINRYEYRDGKNGREITALEIMGRAISLTKENSDIIEYFRLSSLISDKEHNSSWVKPYIQIAEKMGYSKFFKVMNELESMGYKPMGVGQKLILKTRSLLDK